MRNQNEGKDARGASRLHDELERQRFEEWWAKKYNPTNTHHPASLARFDDARDGPVGEYLMRATADAWDEWCANAGVTSATHNERNEG